MKFAFFKQTPIGISRVDVGMITCDIFQSKRTIHPEANIAYMVHFQVALYYPFSGCYVCFREGNYWATKKLYFSNTTEFTKAYPPRNIPHENRKGSSSPVAQISKNTI